MTAHRSITPMYGGKYYMVPWILEHIPVHKTYVEVFGGSAVLLLNKEPSQIEVYNDLNNELTNMFKMLRDKPEELQKLLELTPYSREVFLRSKEPCTDELEQARRTIVKYGQSFGSIGETWSYCIQQSRGNMAQTTSKWLGRIYKNLPYIVQRFQKVQIENLSYEALIPKYDSSSTAFFCDPPYVHDTRVSTTTYGEYEFTEQDHIELAKLLHDVQASVLLSGYESELYAQLYKDWHVLKNTYKSMAGPNRPERIELLWMNDKCKEYQRQQQLF